MATGRDEMLKKNQQKAKKRKGLMEVLSDYQADHGYGSKATKGQGPVKSGKTYGDLLKKNKKEDAGGPKGVLAPMRKNKLPQIQGQKPKTTTSNPKPSAKPQASNPKPSAKPKASNAKPSATPRARQQASTTRSNRNRGATGYGYTGGRGGKPTADTPAPTRKAKPGTGRTGAAAARAANRPKSKSAKPMTAAERMAMRRRARRGR